MDMRQGSGVLPLNLPYLGMETTLVLLSGAFRRAQSSLFRNGNWSGNVREWGQLKAQSSLFRNGNQNIVHIAVPPKALNLPYLGMET